MAALGTLQAATTVSSLRKTSSQTPCVSSSCRSSAGLASSSGSGTQVLRIYPTHQESLYLYQIGRSMCPTYIHNLLGLYKLSLALFTRCSH